MHSISVERVDSSVRASDFFEKWTNWAKTPLQGPEWLLSWWDAFQSLNSQLCILVVRRGADPIGIAPFVIRNTWGFGRTVGFLGSGKACTDFQTLICAEGEESSVADAVGNWLTSGPGRGTWDLVELEGVQTESLAVTHLVDQLRKHHSLVVSTQIEHTWRLDLRDNMEGFLGQLSKTQRSQARNMLNRFDKNPEMSLRYIDTCEDFESGMQTCINLHQMRWEAEGCAGCFSDPRFTAFTTGAFRKLMAQKQAFLLLLELNEKPIASQMVLKSRDGNWFLYQSGRDPNLAHARIGQIITNVSIRKACEQGALFVDFLRGDEQYKPRLKAVPTPLFRIRAFAPAILPKIRYGAWRLSLELRAGAQAVSKIFSKRPAVVADQLSS